MATYDELRAAMDHQMRAADPSRVVALTAVLHQLGDPDTKMHLIHVAGTNGKGSTGAFIAQALRNAGYRVGHFASPAIRDEREQTQIDGQVISTQTYASVMAAVMTKAKLMPAAFTDFEWDVLVTLVWFAQQGCDWAVLEAGLGGATDATNAISAPEAAVFTHIALDHTAILGPTLAAIAHNKAQIIKANAMVFIAPNQAQDAQAVLLQTATTHHATGVRRASAVQLTPLATSWSGTQARLADGTTVSVRMLGQYQLDNARTALAVAAWLVEQKVLADLQPMVTALAQVQLPGRLQQLATKPRVVIDAGHNPDALPQVLATIRQLQQGTGRLLVVAGFLRDKDVTRLAAALGVADAVWVTTPKHPTRALAGATLQTMVAGSQLAVDVHAGLAAAKKVASADDVILVAGSFYLIGDLL
ncbi:bifunctional folylpolyglutamate synthase/dihydrofolate synthase [Lacticaseibacillus sp. GG6-2]